MFIAEDARILAETQLLQECLLNPIFKSPTKPCTKHTTVRTAKHAAAAQGGAHWAKRPPTRPANWPPAGITHHAPARRTACASRTALRHVARRASCGQVRSLNSLILINDLILDFGS